MTLPLASWILLGVALLGVAIMVLELVCEAILRARVLPTPTRFPSFSILKPLCGLDDELMENLQSHLDIDYPGEFELVLGVRSERDLAYPVARDFAAKHPDRVRLVIQTGEPGHNPKVNQLISLTRKARHEIIALTDSNVRVPPSYLREHAARLSDPKVGLSSHAFIGVGEQKLGAILDNLTLASFVAPNIATSTVLLRLNQIVGKSIALRREVLVKVGGWEEVKDVLAEDQRLGVALKEMGLRTALCRTPVLNIQRSQSFSAFWGRHTRWAMIRFRVLIPGVLLEPLVNPVVTALAAALIAGTSSFAWGAFTAISLFCMVQTQISALLTRGHPFRLHHLLLVPFRDVVLFLAWLRGATMKEVSWRGNPLRVLAKTRLAKPEVVDRAKSIRRRGREASK